MKKGWIVIGLLLGFAEVVFCQAEKEVKEPVITKEEIWIDKLDVKSGRSNFGGGWFFFDDKSNGGKSTYTPASITEAYEPIAARNQNPALSFSYKLDQGTFKWEPYVGLGVTVSDTSFKTSIAKIEGIAYDYIGSKHFFIYQLSSVIDYAHYRRMVPESEEWKTMVIPISELRQPNTWGKPVVFDATLLQAMVWNIVGRTSDSGTLKIDNVRLLKKLPETKEEKSEEPKPILKGTPKIVRELSDKVKLADWCNFSTAAYSLTFDDGLISQTKYAAPVLDKYKLKATFYIVSETLESDSTKIPAWRYGYWHQFLALYKNGHELASHSATHPKLTSLPDGKSTQKGTLQYELHAPILTLQKRIPNYKPVTFAYPFVDFNNHVSEEAEKFYISARGLGSGINPPVPSQWMNIQSHGIWYYSGRSLASDNAKVVELEKWIDENTIARKSWSALMVHDVMPFEEAVSASDSWHPISLESFELFAGWLVEKQAKKELWVATVEEVTKYIKEREAVSIVLKKETENELGFSIADGLDDELFNVPLSIEITVPTGWSKVEAVQGNRLVSVSRIENAYRLNVVPDKGDVVLKRLR